MLIVENLEKNVTGYYQLTAGPRKLRSNGKLVKGDMNLSKFNSTIIY